MYRDNFGLIMKEDAKKGHQNHVQEEDELNETSIVDTKISTNSKKTTKDSNLLKR